MKISAVVAATRASGSGGVGEVGGTGAIERLQAGVPQSQTAETTTNEEAMLSKTSWASSRGATHISIPKQPKSCDRETRNEPTL